MYVTYCSTEESSEETPPLLRTRANRARKAEAPACLGQDSGSGVFFDDGKTSETYSERIGSCPKCGKAFERKQMLPSSALKV
jgi:hypothetical protein